MQIFLMRHGIAAPRENGVPDGERALTPAGQKKTRHAAQGLHRCASDIHLIASSPLVRAIQTAEIVRSVWQKHGPAPPLSIWAELEEAKPSDLIIRLRALQAVEAIVLVGHEPGLGRFASFLLTGTPGGMALEFKKAGVCALDVELDGRVARATLVWHAGPRLLEALR